MDPSFFHFTLQGLMIFGSIAISGWKAIKLLRKIDKGFVVWQWEHTIMWNHWVKNNDVPPFPSTILKDEGRP